MAQKSPTHPPSASLRQEGHWLQHSLRGTPWHHLGSATDLRAQGASADGQAAPEDTLGSLYGGADLWVGRQEGDSGLGAGPRHGKWVIMIHPVIWNMYVYIYMTQDAQAPPHGSPPPCGSPPRAWGTIPWGGGQGSGIRTHIYIYLNRARVYMIYGMCIYIYIYMWVINILEYL